MQSPTQTSRARDALLVPTEVFAELDCRAPRIRFVRFRHSCVIDRDLKTSLDGRGNRSGLPFLQCSRLIENPGLTEGPARNHYGRALRFALHPHGVLSRLDVAVTDDWNLQRLNDSSDFFPSGVATVHLRPRARMQRENSSASVLAAPRDRYRIAHLLAPPAANLHRYRQVRASRD